MGRGSPSKISAGRGVQPEGRSARRPGPQGIPILLPRGQRLRLERQCRESTDVWERLRLKIVLLRARGWVYRGIAESQQCSRSTVHRTVRRWQRLGEAGLVDQRQDNGNPKVDDDYREALRQVLGHTAPEYGWTRPTWSRESLVITMKVLQGVKVGLTTMGRALKSIGARLGRPKPVVSCPWPRGRRTRRLCEIRRLADHPPPGEVVLYEDEVDIHLNPKIGLDWMLRATQRRVMTPGQNQKRYIAGAWDPVRREMTWVESDRKRSLLFIDLCHRLLEAYPSARRIHLIVDNFIIHSSKITQRALAEMDGRIRLHFLPPYCPDHNKIEGRWRILHAEVTRNHQHKTIEQLMQAVRQHLRFFARRTRRIGRQQAA